MSVLIGGGTGFIGSHLARKLVEKGERVVLFDSSPNTALISDLVDRVKIVRGDATSLPDILHAVKENEVQDVFHLIALLADVSQEKPLLAEAVNVGSTLNFLEAARIFNLRRIIFASSVAVYDPSEKPPVNESGSLRPLSVYGATKVMSEFYGMHYHRSFGIDFRALRFTTLYGLGKSGGSTGPCSKMVENAVAGIPTSLQVADAVSDWIYIKDAVRSLLLLRESQNPDRRIYNIGGQTCSVRDLVQVLKRIVPGARIELEARRTFPWPPSYDCTNALNDLGYKPGYTIEQGFEDFVREITTRSSNR